MERSGPSYYSTEDDANSITTLNSTITTFDSTTQDYITTTEHGDSIPEYLGFIATIVAILFYGITYAPVKKFDTGDGKIIP